MNAAFSALPETDRIDMTEVFSIDARTREPMEVVAAESTPADIDDVVARAVAAQQQLTALDRPSRALMMRTVARALDEDGDAIVALADRETALGETRLRGELARTVGQFEHFAEVLDDGAFLEVAIDSKTDSHPEIRRTMRPIGTVAVFGAANFPLAFSVPGGDVSSALAAGCAVVAKAHPSHPATSERCARAIRLGLDRSSMPAEALGLIHGVRAGALLVEHPDIAGVGFTGSLNGGRALFDLASSRERPIPFYGELGSVNPVVVGEAAARRRGESIAHDFFASFTLGLGQFCTKPGLLFVPDESMAIMRDTIGQAVLGHAPGVLLNEGVAAAYERRVAELRAHNATVVTSRHGLASGCSNGATVVFAEIAELVDDSSNLLVDECFGPFTVVVGYSDHDQLEATLRKLPSALTATLQCDEDDRDFARRLLPILEERAGRIVWNGYPTGVAVTWAMHHGGPYPASTSSETSVGATAIRRWVRPIAYQNMPAELLPEELRHDVGRSVQRLDGRITTSAD